MDLEAVEMATRASMQRAGAAVVTGLLATLDGHAARTACSCGAQAHYHDHRARPLLTAVGMVRYERPYYVCPRCHKGQCPRDRELDIEGTQWSPGVRRMMAVVGSESSFDQGRQQLELLAGLQVNAQAVERQAEAIGADIAKHDQDRIHRAVQLELPDVLGSKIPKLYIELDGTQVPVVKADTEARAGKIPGQPARTREVKLGCVFTQSQCDQKGRPIRDESSTTYVGAIETAEEFGRRLYTQAWQRGWSGAVLKVILGDGSVWIWNIADQHFPGALQILDLYHAREHIWELAARLFPSNEKQRKRWAKSLIRKLDKGRIQVLVAKLREFSTSNPQTPRNPKHTS